MRISWLWLLLLAICLMFASASAAWAHVRVSPEEVPADSFQVLTVRVPTEKEIPTTGVRVEVPEGFTVSRVQPVPGWDYELEEEGGVVRAISWSGGELGETEFQEFPIQARTPEETGEYAWSAFQTYEDGSVVEWIGPEDAEEPASVVEVVAADGAEADGHGSAAQGADTAAQETGGGFTPAAAYGGLGLGALALVVAVLALLAARRKAG
jgi:uncharacterized protein YcnI